MKENRNGFNKLKAMILIILLGVFDVFFLSILHGFVTEQVYYVIFWILILFDLFLIYLIIYRPSKIKELESKETLEENETYLEDEDDQDDEDDLEETDEVNIEENEPILESDAPLEKIEPTKISKTDKPIEINEYFEFVYQYIQNKGLSIEKRNLIEMFASMSASKLIIVKNNDLEIVDQFVKSFSQFIGAEIFIDQFKDQPQSFDVLLSSKLSLNKCIESAKTNRNKIHFMAYQNVELSKLNRYFDEVINYALDPQITHSINDYNLTDGFPKNMWFMIFVDDAEAKNMPEILSKAAVMINLSAKVVEVQSKSKDRYLKIPYVSFMNLLTDGYGKYYLEESDWKNVDAIEDYVNDSTPFKIDNRVFRQLERYSSTYLLFGGDQIGAVDSMLAAKLLNIIKHKNVSSSEEDIVMLFEKIYGLENLAKSKVLLKEIQKNQK